MQKWCQHHTSSVCGHTWRVQETEPAPAHLSVMHMGSETVYTQGSPKRGHFVLQLVTLLCLYSIWQILRSFHQIKSNQFLLKQKDQHGH